MQGERGWEGNGYERTGSTQQYECAFACLRPCPLTDHDKCSDGGYVHAQNDTHTNAQQTSYTVACRVDWQRSVRDMCWWLDQLGQAI